MGSATEVRRSGRRIVRPVEFWNFEKPEDIVSQKIIYNEKDLRNCSVFEPFSKKYCIRANLEKKNKTHHAVFESSGQVSVVKNNRQHSRGKKISQNLSLNPPERTEVSGGEVNCNKRPGGAKKNYASDVATFKIPEAKRKLETAEEVRRKRVCTPQESSKPQRRNSSPKKRNSSLQKRSNSPQKRSSSLQKRSSSPQKRNSSPQKKSSSPQKRNSSPQKKSSSPQKRSGTPQKKNSSTAQKESASLPSSAAQSDWLPYRRRTLRRRLPLDVRTVENSCVQNVSLSHTNVDEPSFQDVLCSTAVSSQSVSQSEETFKKPDDINGFKRPSHAFRHSRLLSARCQPSLASITEENENDLNEQHHVSPQSPSQKKLKNMAVQKPSAVSSVCSVEKNQDEKQKQKGVVSSDTLASLPSACMSNLCDATSNNESVARRRSSRIRTKPLEFWNFERVEIQSLESGEVSVIHHKQELQYPNRTRRNEYPALTPLKQRPSQESAAKGLSSESSPTKKKLFSPHNDSLDLPATEPEEEVSLRRGKGGRKKKTGEKNQPKRSRTKKQKSSSSLFESKKKKGNEKRAASLEVTCNSSQVPPREVPRREAKETVFADIVDKEAGHQDGPPSFVMFDDLMFYVVDTRDYKCYLASVYKNSRLDLYAGFIFLEHGKLSWMTSRKTSLYVVEGCGVVLSSDEAAQGSQTCLVSGVTACIAKGNKLSVQKDESCKMLKLFILLSS